MIREQWLNSVRLITGLFIIAVLFVGLCDPPLVLAGSLEQQTSWHPFRSMTTNGEHLRASSPTLKVTVVMR